MKEEGVKIVFLTSPNNPDGSMISEEDLLQVLELPALIVLDEAYIEFSKVGRVIQIQALRVSMTSLDVESSFNFIF